MDVVERNCERVALLNGGEIVAEGAITDGDRGFGLVAGLTAAAVVVVVAGLVQNEWLNQGWLTVAVNSFGLTRWLGPMLLPGATPVVNPQWFRVLPRKPWKIALALFPREFIIVGAVITAVALCSLLVVAAPHGPGA